MSGKKDDLKFKEEVDRLVGAESFQPFALTLTSGEVIELDGETFLSFGRDVVTILNP